MKKRLAIFFVLSTLIAASQEPELVLPTGHTKKVRITAFSPDDKYLLTAGEDRAVNIWETFTGKKIKSLVGHESKLTGALFTSNGRLILTATDSILRIWTTITYGLQAEIRNTRQFLAAPRGDYIYILSFDNQLKKYSTIKGDLILIRGNVEKLGDINKDGSLISIYGKDTLEIIQATTGAIVKIKPIPEIHMARFLPADHSMVVISGREMFKYQFNKDSVEKLGSTGIVSHLSSNGRFLLTTDTEESTIKLWDLNSMELTFNMDTVYSRYDTIQVNDAEGNFHYGIGRSPIQNPGYRAAYNGASISNDGRYFATSNGIWEIKHLENSTELPFELVRNVFFTSDNRYIVLRTDTDDAVLWDVRARKIVQIFTGQMEKISTVDIDPSGQTFITVYADEARIVSTESGKTLHILKGHTQNIGSAFYSPDGKYILTNSTDETARLWETASGKLINIYRGQHYEANASFFDYNGKVQTPAVYIDTVIVIDPETNEEKEKIISWKIDNPGNANVALSSTGKYSYYNSPATGAKLTGSNLYLPYNARVSTLSAGDKLFAYSNVYPDSFYVGDPATGKWHYKGQLFQGNADDSRLGILQLLITPGDHFLVVVDDRSTIHVFDISNNYKRVRTFPGEYCRSSGNGKILLVLNEGKCDLYDLKNLELLYSYISIDRDNFLVIDKQKRYDGTESARKLLYYTCGNEIVDLEQFKDKLWVPGLAERIFRSDSIYIQGIRDLKICGFTPEVEKLKNSTGSWEYIIRPGTGGLGETAVYVNGIEVRRLKPGELARANQDYILKLKNEDIQAYYISGSENLVTVRAFTNDNSISSRGLTVRDSSRKKDADPPNLYAVMVGVSDYKGDALDLKYAAKDAKDLSGVLGAVSRNLLNTDGREHVFIYEMTTNSDRYRLPEKLAIRKTLEEIGKKATPNDILLIFFAGHGVMQGEQKQFYFLTAEAASATEGDITDIGISTAELTEWIRPANLKAQKRILIFDACNSGQAIRDIVKIGNEEQGYTAARNDDKAQQAKLIEKLNERSGFTILSAAASNQSAYEMGRYAQGLLTYALLKTVKEDPGILVNGKFLDLGRWFQASGNTVEALIERDGTRQEPQIVSSTNFIIGIVDNKVLSGIKLPVEKPVFTSSIVINSKENVDNLRLSRLLNAELSDMAASPGDSKIIYIPDADSPLSYSVNGSYTISGNQVSLQVNLSQGESLKQRFDITGSIDNLKELVLKVRTQIEKMF